MKEAERQLLADLRHALLHLHKTLLDWERAAYDRVHGRTSPGELLDRDGGSAVCMAPPGVGDDRPYRRGDRRGAPIRRSMWMPSLLRRESLSRRMKRELTMRTGIAPRFRSIPTLCWRIER